MTNREFIARLLTMPMDAPVLVGRYTPKLNTVYSGQPSVQVGYTKSPIQANNEILAAILAGGSNV